MPSTKVGIVYATGSGILRRYIVPTDDAELQQPSHVGRGEAMLVVDQSSIKSPDDVTAALAAKLGKQPPSPRCAVLDALGNVVGIVMADPALDNLPGKALVLNSTAVVGDVLTAVPVASV